MTRALDAAARRFADAQTGRIAELPTDGKIVATVAAVTAGAAADGNAAVTVTWRAGTYRVKGYNRTYTPVVGHRVVCDLIDGQLLIAYSPVGQP